MAKELPYFKFEPSEWENGNIQICSREDKGLFLDLCSMYWARLGELPFKLAVMKLCNGNANAFDLLMQEEIFAVEDDFVVIYFLDEQLGEFAKTSNLRAEAARKRWDNASAMQMHSKSNAIREEKKREEKKRVNKNNTFSFKNSLINLGVDSEVVSQWLQVRKNGKATNTQIAFNKISKQIQLCSLSPNECIIIAVEKSWKGFEAAWVDKPNSFNTKQEIKRKDIIL